MIWMLLGCAGADMDPHNHLELGLGVREFSFRVQRTLSMSCTDSEGTDWLYIHAFSRWEDRDCEGTDTVNDAGETQPGDYPATCDGLEDALTTPAFTGENLFCGGGRMANARAHQATFWFQDWDAEWPVDSLFAGGNYLSCLGSEPEEGDPPRGMEIQSAAFTPELNSSELLVGGDLHGVLDVSHCGGL